MQREYYPVVVQAVAGPERVVYAYFSDGRITKFDMMPLIGQGGVFERLADDDFFRNTLTVMNDTVAWDVSGCFDATSCIDVDPFAVYEAPAVDDPLATAAA